ncbi:MAG: hypothetical protein V7606_504 [Burkholderiales bacterium]
MPITQPHLLTTADLTVIVVTYNSAHCVAALAQTLGTLPHVVVVDNGSADDTVATVAREMPNAKIIRNASNLGFGAANNLALRQAQTSHALLLNPDCIVERDSLERLLDVAEQYPEAGIIAPHLIRKGGRIEVSYRWPNTLWTSRGPAAEGACCVGFVCGAAMLLNMEIMREVGFFDETFFLYYEDEDLCQRTFMQGRQVILAPEVTITHLSRGSVRGPSPLGAEFTRGYHHAQSKLIYTGKHVGAREANALRWKTLLLALATLLPRILLPQPRYLARLVGRISGLWKFKGVRAVTGKGQSAAASPARAK